MHGKFYTYIGNPNQALYKPSCRYKHVFIFIF